MGFQPKMVVYPHPSWTLLERQYNDETLAVEAAMRSVNGITNVWHEDREPWVAEGAPAGSDLVNR